MHIRPDIEKREVSDLRGIGIWECEKKKTEVKKGGSGNERKSEKSEAHVRAMPLAPHVVAAACALGRCGFAAAVVLIPIPIRLIVLLAITGWLDSVHRH